MFLTSYFVLTINSQSVVQLHVFTGVPGAQMNWESTSFCRNWKQIKTFSVSLSLRFSFSHAISCKLLSVRARSLWSPLHGELAVWNQLFSSLSDIAQLWSQLDKIHTTQKACNSVLYVCCLGKTVFQLSKTKVKFRLVSNNNKNNKMHHENILCAIYCPET